MRRSLWCLGTALVLRGVAGPSNTPARAAEVYAPETRDRYFQLEWSRDGKNVNGYVYGSKMTVTRTTMWVHDVPPNHWAYFDVAVPTAAGYRVSVQSFDGVEDRLDRRKAW